MMRLRRPRRRMTAAQLVDEVHARAGVTIDWNDDRPVATTVAGLNQAADAADQFTKLWRLHAAVNDGEITAESVRDGQLALGILRALIAEDAGACDVRVSTGPGNPWASFDIAGVPITAEQAALMNRLLEES